MAAPPTPIRNQYLRIKQRYPHALLLFRLGDFYEAFDDDARIVSRELDITLTGREMGKGNRVPMAGIPYHSLNNHLAKLVNKGYKVAICEQLSPPGKGLVERDVVQVVTPGTVVDTAMIGGRLNNYLAALVVDGDDCGLAHVDITTGEFATTQMIMSELAAELNRLKPSEILLQGKLGDLECTGSAAITRVEDAWFDVETARQSLMVQFKVSTLEGYGCAEMPLALAAAGAVLHYVHDTQKAALGQLTQLSTYHISSFMTLDMQTRKNLELFDDGRSNNPAVSLLSSVDMTKTPMGGRLLRRWLGQPLLELAALRRRQDGVAWFYANPALRRAFVSAISGMCDIERLMNRISSYSARPREVVALSASLARSEDVRSILREGEESLGWVTGEMKSHAAVTYAVDKGIADDPPDSPQDGFVIREGFSDDLDKLRRSIGDSKKYLSDLESRKRDRTGIKSLKVGYNQIFGYYIEVSKANLKLVPDYYFRKQTLTYAERFYTPELKERESFIVHTQERVCLLEESLFHQICGQIAESAKTILATARAFATVDVLASLAEVADRHRYTRPELTDGNALHIAGGRHPCLEQQLEAETFISNDTYLSNEDAQIMVLTGPNMSGKSTYLKQVALIVLLAQIGSFVPANSAVIGITDRIFTRIGAREDLMAGQSTFMVEMVETANILNNATPRSLLILDEIGRGTSTYDGLSIAWAVVEYIHNSVRLGAKTLFATHYHELVDLAETLPRVRNFSMAVNEDGGKVVFLRRILPGGADKSYGIHVARLAGLPKAVLTRAADVLQRLENMNVKEGQTLSDRPVRSPEGQLPLFDDMGLAQEILDLDVDSMSPLECIAKLYELRHRAKVSRSSEPGLRPILPE